MWATTLGVLASGAFLARLLPQPWRLARTGVPDGVSVLATLNSALSDLGWIFYGWSAGLVPVWGTAAPALILALVAFWYLRRQTTPTDLLAAGAWLGALGVAALTGTMALVLPVSVVVTHLPQVWKAVRERELSGIAPATWFLALADATLWGSYGVAVRDLALIAYGVVLLSGAAIILARIWITSPSRVRLAAVGAD